MRLLRAIYQCRKRNDKKRYTGLLLQMQRQEKTPERLPKIYGTQRSFGRTCTQYRYGRIERSETKNNIVSGLLQLQDSRIKTNPALSLLLKEQRQTETALNNLVASIERGILSNTTNKRLHELESRQEELERLILIEKSKTAVKVSEQDIREFYEQALREEPKKLINCLIKEIVLFDDIMEIYFNSPIKKSPDESRGFSFYNSFADMHVYLYSNTAPQVKKMRIEIYVG